MKLVLQGGELHFAQVRCMKLHQVAQARALRLCERCHRPRGAQMLIKYCIEDLAIS